MTISVGYTIANIAALKALTESQRTNGYARLVLSTTSGKPFWYAFIAASTDTADNDFILIPDDEPTSGRWIKSAEAFSVLGTILTGFSVGSAVAVVATDTVLQAFGKIQALLNSKTDKLLTTNRQTASYTLVLGDADELVEMNVATANNLTIPPNADVAFPTGTQILVSQYGAGQTTLVAGSGVTLRSDAGKLKISSQYSGATLIKIGTNEWYVFGSLAA